MPERALRRSALDSRLVRDNLIELAGSCQRLRQLDRARDCLARELVAGKLPFEGNPLAAAQLGGDVTESEPIEVGVLSVFHDNRRLPCAMIISSRVWPGHL